MSKMRLFCWLGGETGRVTLQWLCYWLEKSQAAFEITGVCFALDDPMAIEIEGLAFRHNLDVYDETATLATDSQLGLAVGFPLPLTRHEHHSCRWGVWELRGGASTTLPDFLTKLSQELLGEAQAL